MSRRQPTRQEMAAYCKVWRALVQIGLAGVVSLVGYFVSFGSLGWGKFLYWFGICEVIFLTALWCLTFYNFEDFLDGFPDGDDQ